MGKTTVRNRQFRTDTITGAGLNDSIGVYDETNSYTIGDIVLWKAKFYRVVNNVPATTINDLSFAPDVNSTNWAEESATVFDAYASTVQTFDDVTAINVNYDTVRQATTSITLSAGVITFNDAGLYYIIFNTTSMRQSGTGDSGIRAYVEENTGGGWTAISGADSNVYFRYATVA